MTFEEARAKHLSNLDARLQKLRAVVTQPGLLNEFCNDVATAKTKLNDAIELIVRLNNAEAEASRP